MNYPVVDERNACDSGAGWFAVADNTVRIGLGMALKLGISRKAGEQ